MKATDFELEHDLVAVMEYMLEVKWETKKEQMLADSKDYDLEYQ